MRKMLAGASAALLTCAVMAGAASAASPSSSKTTSGLDRASLKTSMEGDLFEIAGGKLALHKTHSRAVANLGRRLIKDHTKSYRDTVKVAEQLGVPVETSPSPSEVWELKTLAKVSGTTFDRWYTSLEVYDHTQDIEETTDEIKDGSNAAVIADAKQDLPMLKMHLHLSESAYRAVK
jgi:putative membrane protein